MERLHGSWRQAGLTFSVPPQLRARIQVIRVFGARGEVAGFEPSEFALAIPSQVRNADQWVVEVTDSGALIVQPPTETGGSVVNQVIGNVRGPLTQAHTIYGDVHMDGDAAPNVRLPIIRMILPRNIPVQDRL